MRGRIGILWLGMVLRLLGAPQLPVYIEENHAGSFYCLAEQLELEREHTLVLIDAHSDASAAPESDVVRERLRRVASVEERRERLAEWRKTGRIQANDWIEPLMPRPVARVLWVVDDGAEEKQREARRFVDGRLEGEPRKCGSLGERFEVVTWEGLGVALDDERPVLVSLDLDYFSGCEDVNSEVRSVVGQILSLPRLAAVTVALSRPWLVDDAEAEVLLLAAVREFSVVRNAVVRFEPFADCGPDRTRKAKELLARGLLPPRFEIEAAGVDLREELARWRLDVRYESERWKRLLDRWEGESVGWFLEVDGSQRSTDGVVRVRRDVPAAIRLRGGDWTEVDRVRWYQRKPREACYNVLPEVPAGKAFSGPASGWIRYEDVLVAETEEAALAPEVWKRLTPEGTGVVRLWAEVVTGEKIWTTWTSPELELRLWEGEGFHAGLSEQFGLPYVFGAGFLQGRGCDGPETGWGNDCANFLVYAWRRSGRWMPWCNPAQLRRHLRPLGVFAGDGIPLPEGSVGHGVVVHLGNHVAAVWRDVAPVGVLTGRDELVHHLGGFPEVVTVDELMAEKKRPRVEVLMLPERDIALTLAFGGDVNVAGLAGSGREALEGLPQELVEADFAMVNLECVLGDRGREVGKRFHFRAPESCAAMLREAGVDAVGLGNNHAGDFGMEGLRGMLKALKMAGMEAGGAGENVDAAINAVEFSRDGVTVAVLCASDVKPEMIDPGSKPARIVQLPGDGEVLLGAIRNGTAAGKRVVVFVHWGDEYTGEVTDRQREWARRLIDAGAVAVVGAHPHHPQMTDTWKGRPIVYSLGNLVFPGAGPNAGFGRAGVVRFSFGTDGSLEDWKVTWHPKLP